MLRKLFRRIFGRPTGRPPSGGKGVFRVPGQTGKGVVSGSKWIIKREPDKFIIKKPPKKPKVEYE